MFTNMSKKYNEGNRMVRRFGWGARFFHWAYVVCFAMLMLTGLPKIAPATDFLYTLFGGAQNAQILHRIFAILLIASVLFTVLFKNADFWKWFREIFDWKARDFKFLMIFPKEFFGFHAEYPPQGYLNGGTKVNSILQILCFFGFTISGIFLCFPDVLPANIQAYMYPMHTITVCMATAVVFGHIFLAAVHPNVKGGLQGIVHGYVPEYYAREHHGAWLDEVIAEDKKRPTDEKHIMSYEEFLEKKSKK